MPQGSEENRKDGRREALTYSKAESGEMIENKRGERELRWHKI